MALDFLTIQSMSAECERLFSGAGRMVTPCRNRLDACTISISQVLIDELDPLFYLYPKKRNFNNSSLRATATRKATARFTIKAVCSCMAEKGVQL
jgi:hypothetical protein